MFKKLSLLDLYHCKLNDVFERIGLNNFFFEEVIEIKRMNSFSDGTVQQSCLKIGADDRILF